MNGGMRMGMGDTMCRDDAQRGLPRPEVSVIMPVYNTEAYVEDAVRSVLSQDFLDVELICIDDGSTDGTAAVLERLSDEDGRVRVLHRENGGQGSARNRALGVADGKYVYCLDSDDLMAEGCLGKLVGIMEREELDYLGFDGEVFADDPSFAYDAEAYRRSGSYEGVCAGNEMLLRLQGNNDFPLSPCVFMAKREMLDDAGVRFVEDRVHEDDLYSICALLNARRAAVVRETVLLRRYRASSTMTSGNHRASARGHFRNAALILALGDRERYRGFGAELDLCRYIEERLCVLALAKGGIAPRKLAETVSPQGAYEGRVLEEMEESLRSGRLKLCYWKAKLSRVLGKA